VGKRKVSGLLGTRLGREGNLLLLEKGAGSQEDPRRRHEKRLPGPNEKDDTQAGGAARDFRQLRISRDVRAQTAKKSIENKGIAKEVPP